MPALSRRDAFLMTAGAGAVAMLPAPGFAAKARLPEVQRDDHWKNLSDTCREMSRDGDLVVARARARGLKIEDFTGVYMTGAARESRKLLLVFGDWREPGRAIHRVTATGIEVL